MRRTPLIPTALILAALALAGCSATGSAISSESGGAAAPQGQPFAHGATKGGAEKSGAVASKPDLSNDRQVVETGYVTIVVNRPQDAAGDAVRITEQSAGRVDGRNENASTGGKHGSATLTLRIPVSALDATLNKLKALGTVQEVSLSSSDVTMQTQDLGARITALSASVNRLIALLATATDTNTLISLETAISDRQGALESLESQQRYLADQVAMSTITLNLVSPDQAVVTQPNNFFSGLTAGWAIFVAFFSGLLVGLGVLLPWLVLAGIVAFVIILLVRRSRRHVFVAPETISTAVLPKAAAAREK